MKKIIKIFLGVAICMALLITGLDSMDHVNAETAYPVEQLSMSDYSHTEPPTMDGYVFAGWFTDQACTTKVVWDGNSDATNWAKFVPEKVLTLQWQLSKDAEKNSTKTNVRLVTAVAGLDYTNVGFSINGNPRTSETVYHKIYGADEEYTPERLFGSSATHFATYVIWGADNTVESPDATDDFGTSLNVVPQWTTLDGTLVQGKAREVVINDALYEARVENLSGNGAKTDRVWYDTLEAAVNAANDVGGDTEGVVTVLQDAEIESQLNLSTRNMTIQNKYGKNVTISRADDFTSLMIYCSGSGKTQKLITAENDADGSLTVDATTMDVVSSSVVKLGSSSTSTVKFHLGEGVTITGANSDCGEGAVIYVQANATATLEGNLVNNKTKKDLSSLLHILGTVTIADGTYSGNTGVTGGVAYTAGILNITGGTFDNNTSEYGGVTYNNTNGNTTISGGTFQGNSSDYGAVACNNNGSTFISGGNFLDNLTVDTSEEGVASKGGVAYARLGTLEITGGTFTDNGARLGGVAYSETEAQLTIENGTFTSNSADNSGGVVYNNGTASISGGTFNQNQATTGHGGVVYGVGALNISGGEFTSNIANGVQGGGVVYTTNTLDITNGTFDNNKAYNGGVVWIESSGKTTTISGGEFKNHTTMTQTNGSKGGVVFVNKGTLNVTGGTFTNNSARLGGVAFNPAGATIEFTGGTFTSNSATANGGVAYAQDALTISGGEFTSNSTAGGGGVVYATSALTIKNGRFDDNKAFNGGVVYAAVGATISGGEFTNNRASGTDAKGGVAYVGDSKELLIEGGEFKSNTAPWAGVAYNKAGKISITGGTFTENSATVTGGGVILSNGCTINIKGTDTAPVVMTRNFVSTSANNNTSTGGGGGAISLVNAATLTMENCDISGNLHVGEKNDAANMNGCDIAFNRDANKTVNLNDDSFVGVFRNSTPMSNGKNKISYSNTDLELSDTTKRWIVDYTNKILVEYVAQ